jgi:histidine phosphotransfer protein HptB
MNLSTTQSVDVSVLEQLRDIVGTDMCLMLLDNFIEHAAQQHQLFTELYIARDFEQLRRKIHKFRGECLQIGAMALGQLCRELEQHSINKQAPAIIECLDRLKHEVSYTTKLLQQAKNDV